MTRRDAVRAHELCRDTVLGGFFQESRGDVVTPLQLLGRLRAAPVHSNIRLHVQFNLYKGLIDRGKYTCFDRY